MGGWAGEGEGGVGDEVENAEVDGVREDTGGCARAVVGKGVTIYGESVLIEVRKDVEVEEGD